MIEYVKGELVELSPAFAVVDVNGMGYRVNITVNTYTALQVVERDSQKVVKLYIYESIREDAHELFGFSNKKEREVFLLLLTVNGIGANTARMILSEMTVDELSALIAAGDDKMLKRIKGIGPRSAARIIVELQDKFVGLQASVGVGIPVVNANAGEAISALTMLGFTANASNRAVQQILKDTPDASVEEIIKRALVMIK